MTTLPDAIAATRSSSRSTSTLRHGPLREPVDRATVDERGEHAQPVPERLAQRREAEDEMQVRHDARQVTRENIELRRLEPLPHAVLLAGRRDGLVVLGRVEVRDVALRGTSCDSSSSSTSTPSHLRY